MKISAIDRCCPKPNFKSQNYYENPVDREKEQGLTTLQSVGTGLLTGAIAGGISTCFIKETAKHRYWKAGGIGLALAAIVTAFTLPTKLYNNKVNAFTREKEMDVFSRDRELKSNILDEVNSEVKDEDVPLDQKIQHYTTVQMANNGSGLMIKNA